MAVLVAAGLAGAGAGAAPASAATPAPRAGFSIAAEGPASWFRYHVRAGGRVHGALLVRSQSTAPERVLLRAVDVGTAATGGVEYGSRRGTGVGGWISLAREHVDLAPGATARVPFTAAIPPGAGAGDHLAGLVALNRADLRRARGGARRHGFSLRFLPRLAIAAELTVPGPRHPALALGRAGIDVTPAGAAATLLLRNTGNTLLPATGGELLLSQDGRRLLRRRVRLGAFVPGSSITYRLPLRGTPARGTYRLTGELRPRGAPAVPVDATVELGGAAVRRLRQEAGIEARGGTPAAVWAVLAAAVAAAAAFAGAWWRARRALAGRWPSGRSH